MAKMCHMHVSEHEHKQKCLAQPILPQPDGRESHPGVAARRNISISCSYLQLMQLQSIRSLQITCSCSCSQLQPMPLWICSLQCWKFCAWRQISSRSVLQQATASYSKLQRAACCSLLHSKVSLSRGLVMVESFDPGLPG